MNLMQKMQKKIKTGMIYVVNEGMKPRQIFKKEAKKTDKKEVVIKTQKKEAPSKKKYEKAQWIALGVSFLAVSVFFAFHITTLLSDLILRDALFAAATLPASEAPQTILESITQFAVVVWNEVRGDAWQVIIALTIFVAAIAFTLQIIFAVFMKMSKKKYAYTLATSALLAVLVGFGTTATTIATLTQKADKQADQIVTDVVKVFDGTSQEKKITFGWEAVVAEIENTDVTEMHSADSRESLFDALKNELHKSDGTYVHEVLVAQKMKDAKQQFTSLEHDAILFGSGDLYMTETDTQTKELVLTTLAKSAIKKSYDVTEIDNFDDITVSFVDAQEYQEKITPIKEVRKKEIATQIWRIDSKLAAMNKIEKEKRAHIDNQVKRIKQLEKDKEYYVNDQRSTYDKYCEDKLWEDWDHCEDYRDTTKDNNKKIKNWRKEAEGHIQAADAELAKIANQKAVHNRKYAGLRSQLVEAKKSPRIAGLEYAHFDVKKSTVYMPHTDSSEITEKDLAHTVYALTTALADQQRSAWPEAMDTIARIHMTANALSDMQNTSGTVAMEKNLQIEQERNVAVAMLKLEESGYTPETLISLYQSDRSQASFRKWILENHPKYNGKGNFWEQIYALSVVEDDGTREEVGTSLTSALDA